MSVPTAPSVDGFNSMGAPIIIRGQKKTIQSIRPDAIFADLDVLSNAPKAMIAAGFGDMLGKYTSLFDWKFGSLMANEPYSEEVANITRTALQKCVDHVELIAERKKEGIKVLITSLLESGFAMLLFGQSHPASGAEHHLSHYWEMEYIQQGKRQLLHGAKVGVACAIISDLYHEMAEDASYIQPHEKEIADEMMNLPKGDALRNLVRNVGGPMTPWELGISQDLLRRSLLEAHLIRPHRYTLLRASLR